MDLVGLSQFHENESVVGAAQSVVGRLALWVVAILLLAWHGVSPLMMGALSLVMIFPVQRHTLLSIAAAGMIVEKMLEASDLHWQNQLFQIIALLAAGIGGVYLAYFLVKHFKKWPTFARRFPILTLHAGIWLVLALSTLPMLGAFTMVPFLVWRLSYLVALGRRDKLAGTRFTDHFFYLVPVFGGTQTPFGKGLEFLSRHEAVEPQSFARSQLAGIKLLLLAILWIIVLEFMDAFLFGRSAKHFSTWPANWSLQLSDLAEILRTGINPVWYKGWVAIYLEIIRTVLNMAAIGHVVVGCLRLLGFNVFRNTYKPLLAESILEFWNRYYYYFKELLVDFFFYPAYLRLKSLGPRSRMFAAVFMAAFLGNMYHHILADPEMVIQLDLAGFWFAWGPRFVYCSLLAVGIWTSMMRQQKLRLTGIKAGLPWRIRRIAGVWTFYSLIHVWSLNLQDASISERMEFLMSLFSF